MMGASEATDVRLRARGGSGAPAVRFMAKSSALTGATRTHLVRTSARVPLCHRVCSRVCSARVQNIDRNLSAFRCFDGESRSGERSAYSYILALHYGQGSTQGTARLRMEFELRASKDSERHAFIHSLLNTLSRSEPHDKRLSARSAWKARLRHHRAWHWRCIWGTYGEEQDVCAVADRRPIRTETHCLCCHTCAHIPYHT